MVEVFKNDLQEMNRQSSKGNQLKWRNGNVWYKADYTGYEGLAEYVISHLLVKSNLKQSDYVLYFPEEIGYKQQVYCGAKSMHFLTDDWQIITLERLFQNQYGTDLTKAVYAIEGYKERLKFIVDRIIELTGLSEFGVYMSRLLTVDAFFLNEDRHMHNIAVLMNGKGEFAYCPIFDNGAGLLSDTTMDYPLSGDVVEMMQNAGAKTMGSDFDEQLNAAEELYGQHTIFSFNKKDVNAILDQAILYPQIKRDRVAEIIYLQMRKYQYLFK